MGNLLTATVHAGVERTVLKKRLRSSSQELSDTRIVQLLCTVGNSLLRVGLSRGLERRY